MNFLLMVLIKKPTFSELVARNGDDKVAIFIPLLHLDTQHKVFLEQEKHLEEIYVWLKHLHMKKNKVELERLKKEVEEFYANIKEDEDDGEIEERAKKDIKKKSKKEVLGNIGDETGKEET